MADAIYPNALRKNYFANTYCEMAMESYYNAKDSYWRIKKDNYSGERTHELGEMEKQVISAVVFSAMCIESFFNDYSAACLGDVEFYDNFDKLSTISKFQLIAQFILKKEIDKSKSYYSRLKQLIKNRDNYVHNKSRFHEFQGYSKEEYEQIERIKKDADEEYIEYNFSKVSVDDTFNQSLNALKAIYDIAIFFDLYDTNTHAVDRLFWPSGIVFGESWERKVKKTVFRDLGIKVIEDDIIS